MKSVVLTFFLCIQWFCFSTNAALLRRIDSLEHESGILQRTIRTLAKIEGFRPSEQEPTLPSEVSPRLMPEKVFPVDSYGEFFSTNDERQAPRYVQILERERSLMEMVIHHTPEAILSAPGVFSPLNPLTSFFDRRKKVADSHMFPHSIHGLIISKFPFGIGRGSGTVIGEKVFLTAAHCVSDFNDERLVLADSVHFASGVKSANAYKYSSYAEDIIVHPDYVTSSTLCEAIRRDLSRHVKNEDLYKKMVAELTKAQFGIWENDIALVVLKDCIGLKTGWGSTVVMEDSSLEGMDIYVSGYPAYQGIISALMKKQTYGMYSMSGPITGVRPSNLYYSLDTSGGQSGTACAYDEVTKTTYIVGTHTSYTVDPILDKSNRATRLSMDKFDWIKSTLDQLGLRV